MKKIFSSSLEIQNLGAGINNKNGFQSENDQILVEKKGFYDKSWEKKATAIYK